MSSDNSIAKCHVLLSDVTGNCRHHDDHYAITSCNDVTGTCCIHDNHDIIARGHVSSQSLMYSQASGEMTPPM